MLAHDLIQKAEQKDVKREQVLCSCGLGLCHECLLITHQSGLPLDGLARWLEIWGRSSVACYLQSQAVTLAMLQHLTQQRKHNEELLDLLEQQQRTLLQNSTDLAEYEKTLVQMAAELDRYRQIEGKGATTPGKVSACGCALRRCCHRESKIRIRTHTQRRPVSDVWNCSRWSQRTQHRLSTKRCPARSRQLFAPRRHLLTPRRKKSTGW